MLFKTAAPGAEFAVLDASELDEGPWNSLGEGDWGGDEDGGDDNDDGDDE